MRQGAAISFQLFREVAIATGADGLLIEVHYKPEESRCDQRQALSLEEFHAIAIDIEKVAKVMGKKV